MLKPLVTKDISFSEASKKALNELLKAQEDAGKVLSGETETSFSKKIQEMDWAQEDEFLRKTDKILGLGADLMLDPLNFIPVAKLVRGVIAAKGLNPAIDVTRAVVSKSKPAKWANTIFKTSTADKKFMDVVNKFRNLKAYREGKSLDEAVALQKELVKLSKDMPEVNKLVTDALEKPEIYESITDPKVKEIVDSLKQTYKTALEESKSVGLKVGEIEQYAPHIRTKESFLNKLKSDMGLGSKEFSKGAIEKGRKIEDTVSEINADKMVKFFEDNPAIQLAKKGQTYAKAITSQEFANAVKSFALKEGDDLVEVANPMLKGLKFKPEHARIIDNYYTGIKPEEIKVALKGFDTIQNLWKAQALISPSYHIRNVVGNLWNNFLAGVNPFQYGKAIQIQKNPSKYADVIEEMKKVGVLDEGWYAKDIGEEIVDRVSGVKNWKKGINPLSMQNYVFKGNRAIGTGLENNARIAHYLHMKSLGKTAEEAAESVKKFLFDYSDLTPTEKNIFKRIAPFYCVPDDTEILTNNGWKKYKELNSDDLALTYNVEGDFTEWQKIDDVAVFNFNDELMTLESRRGEKFRFTKDHRFPVEIYKTTVKGKVYGGNRKIIRAYELNTNHRIPLAAEVKLPNDSILTEKEAYFLAWLVTDGYHRWRGNGFEAVLYQSPKKHADLIRKEFNDWISSESIHPDTGVICFRIKREKLNNILKYFKSKSDMPFIVTRVNKKCLKLMHKAMMEAEGSCSIKGNQFVQKYGPVLESFQIINLLLGKSFNIKNHKTNGCSYGYVRNRRHINVEAWKKGVEKYKGKIWCPKTKNSTWVMRQNGRVVITGNTWTSKNIPLQLNQLITDPAKFTVPYKVINDIESGVVKPNEKFMNDYLKNNVPVRIRTNKKGETEYFMLGQWLPFASAVDMLSQPIDNIVGMISPFIKNPVEFTTNTSLYFKNTFGDRSKIEQYPGQQEEVWTPATGQTLMRKKYSNILKNIRVLNDINKWIDSSDPTKTADSWQVKLINTLFGKAGTYNVQKSKYFYDKDTDEYLQGLESALKNANKKGYAGSEEATKLRKEIIELKKQRRAQE
jgi:hypothetical protein